MEALDYDGPLSITKSYLGYSDCELCDKEASIVVAVEKTQTPFTEAPYVTDVTKEPNPAPHLWFSHHVVCTRYREYWFRPALEGNVWHRQQDKVTLALPNGEKRIWLLRNVFDENGSQLGVWPD